MNLVSKFFGIKLAGLLIIILFISISGCSSAPDTESQSASENAQLADDTVTTTNISHIDKRLKNITLITAQTIV